MTMRDEINRKVIEVLKSKTVVPWQQPWSDAVSTMPINVLTGVMYRDINPILLRIGAVQHRYVSKWWGTEAQWKLLGGRLLPNAKGVEICMATDKPYFVYNLDCVDRRFCQAASCSECPIIDRRNRRSRETACGQGKAGISRRNRSSKPSVRIFVSSVATWHNTTDRRLITSFCLCWNSFAMAVPVSKAITRQPSMNFATLPSPRMGWLADPGRSVKDRYALGELRSEIGAAYLCAACGIPPLKNEINFDPRSNHSVYLKHWLRMMGEDSSMIFRIAEAASDAAAFLLAKAGLHEIPACA